MSKIKPESEVKRFFNAINTNIDSSLFIICNLLLKKSAEAEEALGLIADNISAKQLKEVLSCVADIETNEKALQEKDTLLAFSEFKIQLLSNIAWLTHLGPEDIINLSANDEFYLYGLIALIRKHSLNNKGVDHFDTFSFDVLQKAGIAHIENIIEKLLKPCDSLPLDDFKSLAKGDIELARKLLQFLQSHPSRFEMGEYFLTQHKELKDELYENWHKTKESIALTTESEASLSKSVKGAAKTHPEFREIAKTKRIKKDTPGAKSPPKRNYKFMGLSGFGTFCMAASLMPKYAALTGAVFTSAKAAIAGKVICAAGLSTIAAPLVAPTSIALFFGGVTYLARNGVEESEVKEEAIKSSPLAFKPLKIKWGS